jgi:Protein of unknown function (DUF3649)
MTADTPRPFSGAPRLHVSDAARHRGAIVSRAIAAIAGGYVLAALCSTALALWLPLARAEAVTTGALASFAVYAGAVMWAFAARTAGRAWAGIAGPCAVLGVAVWLTLRAAGVAA